MNPLLRRASGICLPIVVFAVTASLLAQTPTASDFYMQYRKAFEAATKVEDVMPFMSAATRAEVEETPAAERPEIFEMIKMMSALTNVKITKETPTANGATLTVEALDSEEMKTTGTIEIVKEGADWKLGKESWSSRP